MAQPPSTVSAVAVRRFDGDGDVQRRISSTAVGSSAGSDRSKAYWSGCSAIASRPPPMALRVVSAPAENSRLKNRYNSRSDTSARRRPSNAALATIDSMSSVGATRFDAISS